MRTYVAVSVYLHHLTECRVHTRPTLQPGRCLNRGHERYRHYAAIRVNINPSTKPPWVNPYPTDMTCPVSAMPASSATPRILCSRMEETSVGEAFASPA